MIPMDEPLLIFGCRTLSSFWSCKQGKSLSKTLFCQFFAHAKLQTVVLLFLFVTPDPEARLPKMTGRFFAKEVALALKNFVQKLVERRVVMSRILSSKIVGHDSSAKVKTSSIINSKNYTFCCFCTQEGKNILPCFDLTSF